MRLCCGKSVFFLNDTATTEIYTLSLHDALPIWLSTRTTSFGGMASAIEVEPTRSTNRDRKSTRLNSSHVEISYAVLCLQKKAAPVGPGRGLRRLHGPRGVRLLRRRA